MYRLELPGVEHLPRDVVEPDALAQLVEPLGRGHRASSRIPSPAAATRSRATSATAPGVKPNFFDELLQRRRRAERVHAHDRSAVADVAVPAERRRLLDRDPRPAPTAAAPRLGTTRLAVEELPAGHAHDAGADALGGQLVAGARARARPPTRSRSGSRPGRRRRRRRGRRHPWRLPRRAPLPSGRASAAPGGRGPAPPARAAAASTQRQVSATSFASAGRNTSRPGIARSDASCSTGWCVGPSSPTPIESWVKMWMTGISISAESRIAPRA